jgi:predicted ATPase with chaperone activity
LSTRWALDLAERPSGPTWASGWSGVINLDVRPPGNGKSSISNGIRDALGDKIYIPCAIKYSGQVITFFDPIVHSAAEEDIDDPNSLRRTSGKFDTRYVKCERPTVVTVGELSLSMLDLVYNPTARTYQAPLQLKSSGGIFIIDDLGRQAEPPQLIVNRWIVPLEENRNTLTLQSGEKFEVPFDTLVIFSTNFHPKKIFAMMARKKKIPLDEPALVHLLQKSIQRLITFMQTISRFS